MIDVVHLGRASRRRPPGAERLLDLAFPLRVNVRLKTGGTGSPVIDPQLHAPRVSRPVSSGGPSVQEFYRVSSGAGPSTEMAASTEKVLEAIHDCLQAGDVVVIARDAQPETPERHSRVLSCGGLEVDPDGHEIRCRGRSIKVSELEFRLFEVLARQRPRARSYRELSEAIWGPPYYGDSGALRSLVKRARRKVSPATSGAEIESVRGFGFRLVSR